MTGVGVVVPADRGWFADRPLLALVGSDRTAGAHGVHSPVVEYSWLPSIGPSAWCCWRRLVDIVDGDPVPVVSLEVLAYDLGLGTPSGANSRLIGALARLARFGLVHPAGDALAVRVSVDEHRGRSARHTIGGGR